MCECIILCSYKKMVSNSGKQGNYMYSAQNNGLSLVIYLPTLVYD